MNMSVMDSPRRYFSLAMDSIGCARTTLTQLILRACACVSDNPIHTNEPLTFHWHTQ